MVFFHGGGDIAGDGQTPPFNLPKLASHGVVVVTAEYRLGILGFLAHPLLTAEGDGPSGNYGSLDQIAVLHWVQRNVRAFGGDPHHVMAFGQSAGSWNIQVLLASPSAQGLFSVAGMESGAVPAPGLFLPLSDVEAASVPFVAYFGCNTAADVLACLRAIPVHKIVNYLAQNPNFINSLGPSLAPPFLPQDPFLFFQQSGSPVPLLIGSTREESTGWEGIPNPNLTPDEYAAEIHQEFDFLGPDVADEVLALYPAADYDSPAYALVAVHSDRMTCNVRSAARAAAGEGRPPVWRYLYTHRFENDSSLNAYRAFHTSELYFLFGNLHLISPPFLGVIYTPSAAERKFSTDLMGYWIRFAATGDPNGAGAANWPQYDATTDSMLQLDENSVTIHGYHNKQCDFLSTLPPE